MRISMIVAAADNGVIGREGGMPWRMPSDLQTFRRVTLGKPVIMGRRTLESIGRPLDLRDNIVVTRARDYKAPGAIVEHSIEAAIRTAHPLAMARGADEVMVIGGGEIYRAALPLVDRIYLTRIHASPDGDTFFPELSPKVWYVVSTTPLERGARDDYEATLIVYDRRKD